MKPRKTENSKTRERVTSIMRIFTLFGILSSVLPVFKIFGEHILKVYRSQNERIENEQD